MIRHAKVSEIPDILKVTQACAAHMAAKGIFQWNEQYPSWQAFETDIRRKELFVWEHQKVIIGGIVVSTFMDEEYRTVQWLESNRQNTYIHRLFVHPEYQGRGYARKLMDFAENHSKKLGAQSVRLDTFSKNIRNQRFYEARGYQRLGHIYFPKQSEHPFYCYELILTPHGPNNG